MPQEVTRRRFVLHTLGMIGGATVTGEFLPLLAEAAKRKQILRVAMERDFETLRPELSAGDTVNMLRRLIYTTPILWGTQQRPDGSLIYDPDTIEPVLASSYKVSEVGRSLSLRCEATPNLPMVIPSTPRRSRTRMPGSWLPAAPDSSE